MILHAECLGSGPALALLHGLFGRGRNLGGIARAVSARWRVISLDMRNHGGSPHGAAMDYVSLASDVIETLARLQALPAALLGHSMGGKAACAAALLHPGEVSRLVVADIAPVAQGHGNAAVAAALLRLDLAPGMNRAAADAALAGWLPDAGMRGFLLQNLDFSAAQPKWRLGLAEIAAAMADLEGWPEALAGRRYDGPARFVLGGASDYVRAADHATVQALFPRAGFATVAGAGHWLHTEKPAEFLAATGL